ncbi:MAG: hypothetical protein P1U58_07365 [Verrucomicrobiales bacterium]|nr:hypothetical protein [Verrucomicrobiales bacterium]
MKKFLQILSILTLMTWGGVFLYFYLTGRVEKHLDPSFRVYALISGIGMLLVGGFNLLNLNRVLGLCTHDHAHGEPCDHDHHHEEEHTHDADCEHEHDETCGHDHSHDHHSHDDGDAGHHHHHEETASGIIFSLIVLLVPFLFATGYSRDQFSSEYLAKWGKIERQMLQMRIAERNAARQPSISSVDPSANPYTSDAIAGESPGDADTPPDREAGNETASDDSWATFTLEDLKQMVPQNDDDEFLLDVPQIFYTAGDRELMEVMEGIPVETTAQLMEETLNNPDNTRLKAFRLFIECCAADARPLSIPVDFGQAPPEYTEMGWYRLHGKLHYVQEAGEMLPIIRIEEIEETAEPMDGLLF